MKYLNDIKTKIKWEQFYSPDFDWKNFYDHEILMNNEFTKRFKKHLRKLNWYHISKTFDISCEFLVKFGNRIDWYTLIYNNTLSEEILRNETVQQYIDKNNWLWTGVFSEQNVSEQFMREFAPKKLGEDIPWHVIWRYKKVSEKFISDFHKHIVNFITPENYIYNCWNDIFTHQKLSEKFIRKYTDEFDDHAWKQLARYQTLSKAFIKQFKHKLDIKLLQKNTKIPLQIRKELKSEIF